MSGPTTEVSILDLFADAHRFQCLVGDIPTQVFPQLRLLLAILHRAIGLGEVGEWADLWRVGTTPTKSERTIPMEPVHAYFADPEVSSRFDLLDPVAPFYQVAGLHTRNNDVSALDRLIGDVPSGAKHFTTRDGAGLDRLTFAEAARWLVHCQAYDVSGIKSGAVGDPRVKGGKGYPIGTGQCGTLGGLYAEGRTLAETLLLNLIPFDRMAGEIDPDEDLPVWERPPQTAAEEAPAYRPYGPLDLYTWQSRRIRLVADDEGVTGVLICNGDKYAQHNRQKIEPMTAWRRSIPQEKAQKLPLVYMPRTHNPARALWRGLTSLLPAARTGAKDDFVPPLLLDWLAVAQSEAGLDPAYRLRLHASGTSYGTQNSLVTDIADDSLPMAVTMVVDADGPLRTVLTDAIRAADDAGSAVADLARNVHKAAGGDPELAPDIGHQAREALYGRIDGPFRAWIAALPTEAVDIVAVRRDWEDTVRAQALAHAQQLITAGGPKAWTGRQVGERHIDSSLAEHWFRGKLRKALPLATAHTKNRDPEAP